tara:strand:+ start:1130 stop:1327 length:198 start_codon:yes stop_codon:yes gene_type:complete
MKLLVKKETFEKRYEICKSCNKFIHKTGRCGVCKCFMNVKAWMHMDIKGKLVTCPHPEGDKWIKQ